MVSSMLYIFYLNKNSNKFYMNTKYIYINIIILMKKTLFQHKNVVVDMSLFYILQVLENTRT